MKKFLKFIGSFILVALTFFVCACTTSSTAIVSFNTNGGTSVEEIEVDKGSTISLEDVVTTKEGYSFKGWYSDRGLQTAFNESKEITRNITLHAKWEINQYTIFFEENGGNPVADITQDYGTRINAPTPEREGYVFDGWYEDVDLTTKYTFKTIPAEDKTLYAKWILGRFIISFEENGGSAVSDIEENYNLDIEKPTDPTRRGHTFDGWYTDPEFKDAFSFNKMPGKNITLYAKWTPEVYDVHFRSQDKDVFVAKIEFEKTVTEIEDVPEKEGYTFAGWAKEGETVLFDFNTPIVEETVLIAQWTINQYTLSFDTNGGSKIDSVKYDYDAQLNNVVAPTKLGYTFAGWFNGGVPFFPALNKMPAHDINLVASWTANEYEIVFNSNEGNGSMNNIKGVYDQNITLPDSLFTRVGYEFFGWGLTKDAEEYFEAGQIVKNLTAESGARITLYALWGGSPYDVLFDANGGDGVMSSQEHIYDEYLNLSKNTFTKVGYTFNGWNTKANGTGLTYRDEQEVKNLVNNGSVTLYAQWKVNKYTISFDSNGGSFVASLTQDYESVVAAPETPERTGYTFNGWLYNGQPYEFDRMPAENIELVASWTINQYTISFDENGGSEVSDITLNYGTRVGYPETTSKEGYTFAGWLYNGMTYTFTTMPAENITLVAKWTINRYSITFETDGGSKVSPITANYNETITLPTPTKTGYTFVGWYEGTIQYTSTVIPARNVNLVAKWEINQYTITFEEGEGSDVEDITADYGAFIERPQDPTRDGYEFVGWYYNGSAYTFTTMPARDITLYAVWNANTYTITFEENGGTQVRDITRPYGSTVTKPTNPTRTGYVFGGWYQDEALTQAYTFTTMPLDGITLYAKWNANTYQVAFNANTGSGTMSKQTHTYDEYLELSKNTFTKTGYTFVGWNTLANGTGTPFNDEEEVINLAKSGSITLYAQWTVNNYIVNFDPNSEDALGYMPSQSFSYTESKSLTLNTFEREGYTFLGWNTNPSATTATYRDGYTVSKLVAEQDGSITLYAVWKANTYVVKYNGNTASGTMGNQTFTYDVEQTLAANGFRKTGYTFVGWNTQADGNGTTYNVTTPVKNLATTGSITLYAMWEVNTYTVVFNANTGSGTMNNQTFTYNVEQTLAANLFEKEGYTFVGWNTLPNGTGTTHANGATVNNLAYEGTVTLYAQWTANEYTITFVTGDNAVVVDPITDFYKQEVTLPAPTRVGYTFNGWYVEGNEETLYKGKYAMPLEGETLLASWTANKYTITFNANGGSNVEAITQDYATAVTAPVNPTKVGYTFAGWTYNGSTYTFTTMPAEDIELVANWTINQYTISFDSNGGSDVEEITNNYGEVVDAPANPTRVGYTFAGWTYNGSAYTFTTIPAEDIELKANWTANTYTVVFDKNTASGTMGNQTFTYDVEQTLAVNAFTKAGYHFVGWDTNPSAITATYDNEEEVKNLAYEGTVTLYAIWEANTYTVVFDKNTGSGTMENQTFTYDVEKVLSANGFEKEGYTFAGWNTSASGNGTSYNVTTPVKNLVSEGEVRLYAQWTANKYTITFVTGDNAVVVAPITDFYKQEVTLPAPTRVGYTFNGWYVEGSEETLYTGKYAMPLDGETLLASWTINKYKVTFTGYDNQGSTAFIEYEYNAPILEPEVTPSIEGFEFKYWALDGVQFVFGTTMPARDIILTAEWENLYTVVFKDGQYTYPNQLVGILGEELETFVPTKDGYTFIAWHQNEDLTDSFEYPETMPEGGLILYAEWVAINYTIEFDSNGGSTIASITQGYETEVELPTPTKVGYTFNGWYVEGSENTLYKETIIMPLDGETLYASWTANTYVVEFDANGGTNAMADQTHTYDQKLALTANNFVKVGYTFAGWNTLANGQGDSYENAEEVENLTSSANGHVKLYAQWTANRYTITLVLNGGVGEESVEAGYEEEVTAPVNPTKVGYTFVGWYGNEALTQAYTFTTMPLNGTTVYASWTPNNYTIEFVTGDDEVVVEDKTAPYKSTVTLPTPTRVGYTFNGWYVEGSEETLYSTYEMPLDGIVLHASWTINQYTITFNANGGSNVEAITQDYATAVTAPANPTRVGYTFAGWTYNGSAYTFTTMPAEDIELVASWTINQYTITFIGNGGTSEKETITQDYNTSVTLPSASRDGYAFAGWLLDGSLYEEVTMPAENIELVASWTANKYTVVFVANGGEGTMDSQEFTYDVAQELTANNFTKVGYTFNGWLAENGKTYTDKEEVSNLLTTNNGSVMLKATWKAKSFTITLVLNGGEGATSVTGDYEKEVTLPTPERSGYTFAGWYSNQELTSPYTFTTMPLNGTTVYAKWTPINYTIIFDAQGGSDVEAITQGYETEVTLTTPTRVGYNFLGWYLESDADTLYNETISMPLNGAKLLASWEIVTYTITLDENGGESVEDVSGHYQDELVLPRPTRDGYTFAGWYEENTKYTKEVMEARNIELTAKWLANTYTVVFNSNNGTEEAKEQTFTFDAEALSLTKNTFIKTGYTFAGWATAQDSNVVIYEDEKEVRNLTSDANGLVELYAVWTANTYTVTFDANGGEGEMNSQAFVYGVSETLDTNAFTRTGYTFLGWNTAKSATVATYNDQDAVSTLSAAVNGKVTLYAVWAINQYTISFETGDDKVVVDSITQDYNTIVLEPNRPTRDGYTFGGWYTNKEFTSTYTFGTAMPAEDTTVYVRWVAVEYTITLELNGGQGTTSIEQDYATKVETPVNPTRVGYAFAGWYADAQFEQAYTFTTMPLNGTTVYAKWTANTYVVEFDPNFEDITGTTQDQTFTYDVEQTLRENGFVRVGYTFAGWNTLPNGNGIAYDTVTAVKNLAVEGAITLYAQWTANTYDVIFDKNNGLGTMNNQTFTYDESQTLNDNHFTRDGYTFVGWNTQADGNGTTYNTTTEYSNLTTSESITLYAMWEANKYTISFNYNTTDSIEEEVANMEATYDVTTNLPKVVPTRVSHDFVGWADNADGIGKIYEPGDEVKNLAYKGEITLYAVWEIKTYEITFIVKDIENKITYNYGESLTSDKFESFTEQNKDLLYYEGHTLAGWVLNGSTLIVEELANISVKEALTLTAEYTINTYTVEFISNGGVLVRFENQTYGADISFAKYLNIIFENAEDVTSLLTAMDAYQQNNPLPLQSLLVNNEYIMKTREIDVDLYNNLMIFLQKLDKVSAASKQQLDAERDAKIAQLDSTSSTFENDKKKITNDYAAIWKSRNDEVTTTFQRLYGYASSVQINLVGLYNSYMINDGNPSREGFVFSGWTLGEGTVYNGEKEFKDKVPASNSTVVTIVAKWEQLATIGNVSYNNNEHKLTWDPVDTSNINIPQGTTTRVYYEVRNFETETVIAETTTNEITISVPGKYAVAVIGVFEILNEEEEVIKTYYTKDPTTAFTFELKKDAEMGEISDAETYDYFFRVTEGSGENAETVFYFFTNMNYIFNANTTIYIIDSEGNIITDSTKHDIATVEGGNTLKTKDVTGDFYFKSVTDTTSTKYHARVYPYISQFDLGANLQAFLAIKENHGQYLSTNESDYVYYIGHEKTVKSDYANNGFVFDLSLLTTNGNRVDLSSLPADYFVYEFFNANGTPVDTSTIATFTRTSDGKTVWNFKASTLGNTYTMKVSINTYYFPDVIKEINAKKEFTFTINDCINVYTHEILKDVYANTGEDYRAGINLHANITSELARNQKYNKEDEWNPTTKTGNYFIRQEGIRGNKREGVSVAESYQNLLRDQSVINLHWSNLYDWFKETDTEEAVEYLQEHYAIGHVYSRISQVDLYEDYKMNGNFFTVDGSKLEHATVDSWDNLSPVPGYKITVSTVSIFLYMVADYENKVKAKATNNNELDLSNIDTNGQGGTAWKNGTGSYQGSYWNPTYQPESKITFSNIKIIGNTKTPSVNFGLDSEQVQNAIDLMNKNSGGHCGIMGRYGAPIDVHNTVIASTTIGIHLSERTSAKVTNTSIYSSWAQSIYGFGPKEIEVQGCEFKESGGVSIHVEDIYTTQTTVDAGLDVAPVVKIHLDNVFKNFISGEEAWFKSNSMELMAMQLKALMDSQLSEGSGGLLTILKLMKDEVTQVESQKMNFIFMTMSGGANASGYVDGGAKATKLASPEPYTKVAMIGIPDYGMAQFAGADASGMKFVGTGNAAQNRISLGDGGNQLLFDPMTQQPKYMVQSLPKDKLPALIVLDLMFK